MFDFSQFQRGYLAAERAHRAGEQLNPNRWIGKGWEFRDGFESKWADMEFRASYERGETEFLPPMYGLCRECDWPLEDDQSQYCRKCVPAGTPVRRAYMGFRRFTAGKAQSLLSLVRKQTRRDANGRF